jgi:hypothetical protein
MTTQELIDKYTSLFNMIQNVLIDMKHYNDIKNNDTNDKFIRYRYIKNIYLDGIESYISKINKNIEDFKDFHNNPCYLKDFENENELNEWILSGMSKKEQDEFFLSGSESPDSQ